MNAEQLYEQILKQRKMGNVYKDWCKYREQLTNYIITNTESDKSIAIFGAGGCNDLDICKMSKHFNRIILLDNDKTSVDETLKRLNLGSRNNIEFRLTDFTGINDDDYISYIDVLVKALTNNSRNPDLGVITNQLLKCMDNTYNKIKEKSIDIEDDEFDYSVTVGVHSQLNNMFDWMWSVFMSSYQLTNDIITQKTSSENDYIVNKLNNAIFISTKLKAFIGCEKNIVGNDILVEGAYQAINDIKQRHNDNEIKIEDMTELIWPFDKKRNLSYNVELYKINLQ